MTGNEKKLMRNSTAEFLIFTSTAGEESIEVRYEDETIWLSQKMMATLFDVSIPTINFHLKKIFESGELTREATIRKFLMVRTEGNRDVSRNVRTINFSDPVDNARHDRMDALVTQMLKICFWPSGQRWIREELLPMFFSIL